MIISEDRDSLVLVAQDEHGMLAGQIVCAWGNESFERPEPFDSVHYALRHHDHGWIEPDGGPMYDEARKRPRNFIEIDLRKHAAFYRRGVEMVEAHDAYAGLLVGLHWTGLYRGRWGIKGVLAPVQDEDREFLDGVIREEEARWAAVKDRIWQPTQRRSAFEARLWHNYDMMQAWDLLSIYVCRREFLEAGDKRISAGGRRPGEEPVEFTLSSDGKGQVSISPYPFSTPSFEAVVTSQTIANVPYESKEAVSRALAESQAGVIRCHFVRAEG